MGLARSTFYDHPKRREDDTALVEAMHAIKDKWLAPHASGPRAGRPHRESHGVIGEGHRLLLGVVTEEEDGQ